MKDVIDAMMSSEFLGIYIAIGILILLMIAISVIDYYLRNSKKEVKHEKIEEIEDVIEEADNSITIEDKSSEISEIELILDKTLSKPIEEDISLVKEKEEVKEVEEIKYVDESMEQTNAQLELKRLTEELKKAEEVSKNIELTNFELEQEETAIISLDELMAKGDALYDQNEITQYEDEGNEPINLKELEERYRMQQEEEKKTTVTLPDDFKKVETKEPVITAYENSKKFKSSPVISPIYGIEDKNNAKEQTIELENTANYDKLDEEIRKTNEFLQILKELQKKLD